MSRQSRTQGQPSAVTGNRQNEYFVPRDGIDREVISSDICRYLGNDALVRPGHYENPQTGQIVQGYYITAYRNLTTAMIEDLKADSARWESERRTQTTRAASGVHYRYSETHQSRQHHGPTEGPYPSDPYARDPGFENSRYPGSYPAQQSYAPSGGAYNAGYQQPHQGPVHDPRFTSSQPASMMRGGYPSGQDSPFVGTGANMPNPGYSMPANPYASRPPGPGSSSQQPMYTPLQPPGYRPSVPSYQHYPGQGPTGAGQSYPPMQPHDPYYGRVSQHPGHEPQGRSHAGRPQLRSSAALLNLSSASAGTSALRMDRENVRHQSTPRQ